MSRLSSTEVKTFLLSKKGYIKKSPIITAQAIWKQSPKIDKPKTSQDLQTDLKTIKSVQQTLRTALSVPISPEDKVISSVYDKIISERKRPKKRLFFDIEVSANIVFSWSIGEVRLSHDDIIKERSIICVCYKWEHEKEVHSLEWNKGDDSQLVKKFAKIISSADEVVTQNGDSFDIKWFRTRCLFHGVPIPPKLNSIDTLKMARAAFRFNSNKLDYMGQFMNVGKKIKTDYSLWKEITLYNSNVAMKKMVDYCKQDVLLLEKVYKNLIPFVPPKKFKYKL